MPGSDGRQESLSRRDFHSFSFLVSRLNQASPFVARCVFGKCFWNVNYVHTTSEKCFILFFYFLLCCWLNPPTTSACTHGGALTLSRTHGRVINCTNYTGGRKHRFYLALSGYPTFGTILSGCRRFQIKRNIPIESWIMRNWRRLV